MKNESEPLFVSHPRRIAADGTPMYQKESEAHIKLAEREREEAMARNRTKERQAKLGVNFDIIGPDGVKRVYDWEGRLVPEPLFEQRAEEAERAKKRLSLQEQVPPHGVEIIEKTRRFVQELRKRVEMVCTYRVVSICSICCSFLFFICRRPFLLWFCRRLL